MAGKSDKYRNAYQQTFKDQKKNGGKKASKEKKKKPR